MWNGKWVNISSFQWGCLMILHRELEKPMLRPPRDIIESLSPTGKFWYNNKTWSFPMQWAMQKTKGHNFIRGQQTWKNNLGQRERAPLHNTDCDLEAKCHTKDLAGEEQRCDSKFDPKMQYAETASLIESFWRWALKWKCVPKDRCYSKGNIILVPITETAKQLK